MDYSLDSCLKWPGLFDRDGYPISYTNKEGAMYICRLVLEQKLGRDLTPGKWPYHSCGNRWCVNPLHLCEVNRHTPIADRTMLSTWSTLELKKDAVYQARYLIDRGRDQTFIAEVLGLPSWVVGFIINSSIWDRLHYSSSEKVAALVQLDPIVQPGMCFPIPHVDNHGYAYCHMNGKRYKASRFAYALGHGKEPDPLSVIHHKCNNPDCVRPSHLLECDQKTNIKYRRNPQLDADIEIFGAAIVEEIDSGRVKTFSALARKFEMDDKQVKRIYHRVKALRGEADPVADKERVRRERYIRTRVIYEQHGDEICRMLRDDIGPREIGRKFGIWHTGIRKFCKARKKPNDQSNE